MKGKAKRRMKLKIQATIQRVVKNNTELRTENKAVFHVLEQVQMKFPEVKTWLKELHVRDKQEDQVPIKEITL